MWELHDPQYGEWDNLGCRDRECRVGKWEPMSVTQISDQIKCLGSWAVADIRLVAKLMGKTPRPKAADLSVAPLPKAGACNG